MTSLVALFLMAVVSVDVTATRLNGTTVNGELRSWADNQLVLATADGEQKITGSELLSLRASTPPTTASIQSKTPAQPSVELVDGTILSIDEFSVAGTKARIKLHGGASAAGQSLLLDVKQLAAVRLQPLESALAEQWEEVRNQNLASDVLVVLKRDGASLDYAEGIVGEVSSTKVVVELDGESMRVDRGKVAGFIYFRPKKQSEKDTYCTLQGRGGAKVVAESVTWKDELLHVRTVTGIEFNWPIAELELADFSAGKVMYLSDLEPAFAQWTPLVALPTTVKAASEFGRPRRDQSAFGGPLMLASTEDRNSSAGEHLQSFGKGLAVRSRTELIYKIPPGFQRFVAIAGIDPSASKGGNVALKILADDRPILDKEISSGQPLEAIDVVVENAKRLKIVVDYGQNLDTGDWLNLCDARIVK